MKFGIALVAGLLIAEGTSSNFQLQATSCQVKKVQQNNQVNCNCTGGSGDYDWHFSELPDGWSYNKDQIIAPGGKFDEKKLYGAKIEILDKKTK